MDTKIKLLQSELGEHRVKTNIDISDQLDSGLGGVVSAFYLATTPQEIIAAITLCHELKINFLLIGSGSKVALGKGRFDGLVIKNRTDNLKISGIKGQVSRSGLGISEALIEAESGVSLKALSEYVGRQGLSGFAEIERAPGTVGGSLSINQNLRERVHQVTVLTPKLSIQEVNLANLRPADTILSVVFKLKSKV